MATPWNEACGAHRVEAAGFLHLLVQTEEIIELFNREITALTVGLQPLSCHADSKRQQTISTPQRQNHKALRRVMK